MPAVLNNSSPLLSPLFLLAATRNPEEKKQTIKWTACFIDSSFFRCFLTGSDSSPTSKQSKCASYCSPLIIFVSVPVFLLHFIWAGILRKPSVKNRRKGSTHDGCLVAGPSNCCLVWQPTNQPELLSQVAATQLSMTTDIQGSACIFQCSGHDKQKYELRIFNYSLTWSKPPSLDRNVQKANSGHVRDLQSSGMGGFWRVTWDKYICSLGATDIIWLLKEQ